LNKLEENKNLTDEELIHRYRNSYDMVYIGELYERYTHLVFGVCLKHLRNEAEAEDATMQVFEKLITELKKHHIVAFKPWLHVVVKNHCMMYFRKDAIEEKFKTELKHKANDVVENAQENHLQETDDKTFVVQYLKEGMEGLKEEQRNCVELFYMKDLSYNEISTITGYNLNEVKSYIQNGKRNLRNYITAKHEQAQKGHDKGL